MEKVTDVQDTPEVFKDDIELYIKKFCEDLKIDDMSKESQSRWNACLMFVRENVFKNKSRLKRNNNIINANNVINSNYNMYDYDKVLDIVYIYYYYCCLYDKECSYVGFSLLTGIDINTLIDWGKGDARKLSTVSCEISQKLKEFREESLSNKLATGARNPVGVLAILNRHFAWNMPGVSRENSSVTRLTANDIRSRLTASIAPELPENMTQLTADTADNNT